MSDDRDDNADLVPNSSQGDDGDDRSEDLAEPGERRGALVSRTRAMFYQSPIPPPEVLRAYDDCVPGSARRILDRFESESDHRREMEANERDLMRRTDNTARLFIVGVLIVSALAIVYKLSAAATVFGCTLLGTTALSHVLPWIASLRKSDASKQDADDDD